MNNAGAATYVSFYDDQISYAKALGRRRLLLVIAMGVVLIGLLVMLHSLIQVMIAVAILYFLTYYGLNAVQTALRYAEEALTDLSKLASFVRETRSKSEVAKWAEDHVKADDSNVPEAIRDLCNHQVDAGSMRVSANAAFTQPSSQLTRIYFLRTALVLGGLFGTVLFFAFSLGGQEIVNGDLGTLLPQLRGALASTLTGILGSVLLGHFGSEIDGLIERSTWETEAFLTGSIAPILQEVPELSAVNEVQLWSLLLNEVRQLRIDTTESYAKLGNDATIYGVALQAVSDQLANLPAIQVPAQLANLQDVVDQFHGGLTILDRAVTSLIAGVSAVGLYFPAKTVERLDALQSEFAKAQTANSTNLTGLKSSVDRSISEVRASGFVMSDAAKHISDVAESVVQISSVVSAQTTNIDVIKRETIANGSQQADVVSRVGALPGMLTDLSNSVQVLQGLLEKALLNNRGKAPLPTPVIPPLSIPPEAALGGEFRYPLLPGAEATEVLTTAIAALAEAEREFRTQSSELAKAIPSLGDDRQVLLNMSKRVQRLDSVFRWHERAARAPLMKLLLMPLRREREAGNANA